MESNKLQAHKYYHQKQKPDKLASKSKGQFIVILPESIQAVPEQWVVEYPNGVKLLLVSKSFTTK